MSFNSSLFIFLFFPVSLLGFWISKLFKSEILVKLYLVGISLLFIIVHSIVSFFYVAFVTTVLFVYTLIGKKKEIDNKPPSPAIPIIVIVAVLAFYKYYPLTLVDRKNEMIIPLGISFISFEAISYLLDCYWKKSHYGEFLDILLFISFFPKVISGPIVLWRDFSSRLNIQKINTDNTAAGLSRVIIGLFQKVFIADVLSLSVEKVYSSLPLSGTLPLIVTIFAYSFEIYFDFLGYSNIALGLCNIFGFSFKENFIEPYKANGIGDFWRRWHISLGTWFREYVYIPLGGNKSGNASLHLFIVFILSGIWHGSTVAFVLWGILHGLMSIAEKKTEFHSRFLTFLFVSLMWILFRSGNITTAFNYFRGLTNLSFENKFWSFYDNRSIFILVLASLICWIPKSSKNRIVECLKRHAVIYYSFLILIFVVSILFAVKNGYSPFLYFQF